MLKLIVVCFSFSQLMLKLTAVCCFFIGSTVFHTATIFSGDEWVKSLFLDHRGYHDMSKGEGVGEEVFNL